MDRNTRFDASEEFIRNLRRERLARHCFEKQEVTPGTSLSLQLSEAFFMGLLSGLFFALGLAMIGEYFNGAKKKRQVGELHLL